MTGYAPRHTNRLIWFLSRFNPWCIWLSPCFILAFVVLWGLDVPVLGLFLAGAFFFYLPLITGFLDCFCRWIAWYAGLLKHRMTRRMKWNTLKRA